MPTCADIATEMLELGFSVIPVRSNDKKPIQGFFWQQYQGRLATEEEVEQWFAKWPDANLALICGSVSGVWALDADGPLGIQYMQEHCPRTSVYQSTPGGGYHALYRLPRGRMVKNKVRVKPELDIRGEGGYIVISPSTIGGISYEWTFLDGLDGWEDLTEWAWEESDQAKKKETTTTGVELNVSFENLKPMVSTTTPVAQGSRNSELARVAGKYFSEGLGLKEVQTLCAAWNREQCKPPLGASELQTTVKSIAKSHIRNHPEATTPPPRADLKVAVPEPPTQQDNAIPTALLYPGGTLEQIMEYIEASTPASFPLFNLAAAITLIGAIAGQRLMTETGLRTNFYSICLGYSGSGKDGPLSAINHLIGQTRATMVLGPNNPTSAAAILKWVKSENGKRGRTMLMLDEIGLLLKGMKKPNSAAAEIPRLLMEMWSATDRSYTKSYGSVENLYLPWHHVSMYGTSTPRRFWESMTSGEAIDGFLARILVWESRHDAPLPKGHISVEVPPSLAEFINGVYEISVQEREGDMIMGEVPIPHIISKTPEAREFFAPWAEAYHNLKNHYKEEEDGRSPVFGRAAEHAHKLALVHAISRCGAHVVEQAVDIEDVKWAMAVVDYLVPQMVRQMQEHVADSEIERIKKKVLSFIGKRVTHDKPGVSRAEILRGNRGLTKKALEELLSTLEAGEQITVREWQNPKGGPVTQLICLVQE